MPKINKKTIKEQKEEFLNNLSKNLGILTPSLTQSRIAYQTYAKWFKEDDRFRRDCIDIDNMQGDFVENKLLDLIGQGNVTAIIFYLKCRRHEKWNDRANQINVNVSTTEFQIGSSMELQVIDLKETKLIDEN